MDIISGTEVAYQTSKPTETEVKDFNKKWEEHKEKYIKDNSLEEMVYENGSALALLYKEVQRLNTLLMSNLQTDGNKEEHKK